jgi:hypothetical protein
MPFKLRVKRGAGNPAASALDVGELGFNTLVSNGSGLGRGKLFVGSTTDGTTLTPIGVSMDGHTHTLSNITDVTTVGANLAGLTNPGAITFLRVNANNTVSALSAADFRTAIGAGTSSTTGTVTSINLTAGTGITVSGGPITSSGSITVTNSAPNATHTGDVTGATALTIANDAVTFAKMQDITTARMLGRVSASTGDIEELTATQVRTFLNVAEGATANTGTVTSIATSGTVAGLTLTGGTITTTGTITLGGTLSTPVSTINDSTTVGQNLVKLANVSDISFIRVNANNTVTALSAADFRTAIGASTTNGTVTSVGLALPNIFTVSGSPVTGSGTLTGTLANQNANLVFAGPNTGAAAAPTFRSLVAADIPALAYITKTGSRTVGNIPTFDNTDGGSLGNGYTVETTFTGGSGAIPRADAVKAYIDSRLSAADAMIFKGTIGTGGTLTIAAFNSLVVYEAGWSYKIIEAGTVKGNAVEIGDLIIATVDRASSGVNADWTVVQSNLDGAVIGPASSTNNALAVFDSTSGKLLKNSTFIPTTVGGNLINLANPSAVRFIRVNADNSVSALSDSDFRTAIGAQVSGSYLTGNQTITLSGDVTGSGATAITTTIANSAVTLGKMANLAANSIIGNNTGSAATPIALTAAQVRTLLNVADGATANAGTVTSVGGTGTVSGLTLTGTVTSSGNLTLGGTLAVTASNFASQTQKTFLAAPNAADGTPTFRTIVASDVPTLNQNTTGSAGSVAQAVTFNNGGSGVASGTTYNGSTARTVSYNTIGAAAASHAHGNITSDGKIGSVADYWVVTGADGAVTAVAELDCGAFTVAT